MILEIKAKELNLIGKSITVNAPATVANLVCGFDILGMALSNPFDFMTITIREEKGIIIRHEDKFDLPEDPFRNVAGVALLEMMNHINLDFGFEILINKQIKPGSGLGSSAASAAGVVGAVNSLLDNAFSNLDLIRFAMAGEKLASGVKHADNVAPCIIGGITLIRSAFPLDVISLSYPLLFVTIIHPQIEVKTSDARDILRKEVQLKTAIKQWGNIAGLVTGLINHDYDLIERSLVDEIIEPVRSILIPEFAIIKSQGIEAGALGGGIAGSGPSIFMLSKNKETALVIKRLAENIYDKIGLPYYTYVSTVNEKGVSKSI
ncbi:MAG: homoserine kinase [Ginsengibacter sp.]